MSHWQQRRLQEIATEAATRSGDNTRHKCFVSYHADDAAEVAAFLEKFGTEFIAKTIGVTDEDDFIDSQDADYVMNRIRSKYLGDSTVTIVLVGKCTWARRYVDWEVYSSLRNSKHSSVNGLMAIQLPSASNTSSPLPARVSDNVSRGSLNQDIGYARYYVYPRSTQGLRDWISDAHLARNSRGVLIDNTRARKLRSSPCTA